MDEKVAHLKNENERMRSLLGQIAQEYGDRSGYGSGLFTSAHQPFLIQQAMLYSKTTGEVPE